MFMSSFPTDSRSPRAFSTVELLLVMAVMITLATLAATSLGSMTSKSLTACGNQLMEAAALARQNSAATDGLTAIVVKTRGKGAHAAYCILNLTRDNDGSYPVNANGSYVWRTISPWRNLSTGIMFDPDATFTPANFLAASANPLFQSFTYPYQ